MDLFSADPLVFKKLIYEMRFDEVSAVYALFGGKPGLLEALRIVVRHAVGVGLVAQQGRFAKVLAFHQLGTTELLQLEEALAQCIARRLGHGQGGPAHCRELGIGLGGDYMIIPLMAASASIRRSRRLTASLLSTG